MSLTERLNTGSLLSIIAIAAACVVVALSIRNHAITNDSNLHRYLQVLPSVALEMVKAQSSLEASDGRVLMASQIQLLEESFGKLLSIQSSSFNPRRLAMKLEILRSIKSKGGGREIHRFGVFNCEPSEQLAAKITGFLKTNPTTSDYYPQYQATLCYLDRDGTTFRSSASSLD